MKYKDLIEKLQPYADKEINMTANRVDIEKVTEVETRFFHEGEEGDFIVGVKQRYNKETFENLSEATIITM